MSGAAWAAGAYAHRSYAVHFKRVYVYHDQEEAGMKAKLTVTIDEELIPKAKEQARSQGVSLSDLIERALRGLTLEKRRSFSARWRGRFKAARRKDDRYKALAEKYL
jgi:post-segregation antitoxin (ccd killing protein)